MAYRVQNKKYTPRKKTTGRKPSRSRSPSKKKTPTKFSSKQLALYVNAVRDSRVESDGTEE